MNFQNAINSVFFSFVKIRSFRLIHCYKSMTNREDEILASVGHPTAGNGGGGGGGGDIEAEGICQVVPIEYVCNDNEQTNNTHLLNNTHDNSGKLCESWSENPPSSASSGFSDDDSLAGTEGDPKTIEQIVQMVRERGRHGLVQEYAEIRGRNPEGTFSSAK